jgi:hypothetical protein
VASLDVRPESTRTRRAVLRAVGAAAVGGAVLGGATGRSRAAPAVRPSAPAPTVRRYAGELTGTLRYVRGGAGGDRTAETATVTHAVDLAVFEYGTGVQGVNPLDIVLATTPAVTVPQEGDLNLATADADVWAGEIIDYRPAWAVSHDPASGATRGVMHGGDAANAVWVWWFGISGTIVPEPLAPPSSFSGTVTDEAVTLQFDLGTVPPEHVLRADLTATRTQ